MTCIPTRPTDLTAQAAAVELETFRRKTCGERGAILFALSDRVVRQGRRAIQRAMPQASVATQYLRFASIGYGPEFAAKLTSYAQDYVMAFIDPNLLGLLTEVVQCFETLGIRYHIGGSVASSIYGFGRSTRDADLIADVEAMHAPLIEATFVPERYASAEEIRDAVRHRSTFNILDGRSGARVDVFVPQRDAYSRIEQSRVRMEAIDDAPGARLFAVNAPEDIVLRKLAWYRMSPRDVQLSDAREVLQVQAGALDLAYMERWATTLGVDQLLAEVRRAAGV